jgi:beta-ureidopropionase / N-carbamoyl-L-amino-acid hydrolase
MTDDLDRGLPIDGPQLLRDLRELATIGGVETGVERLAFSPDDVAARRWVAARMAAAGLEASTDRYGTVYGRAVGASRAVLIGSHTDTVPRGGWLDGALGVAYGLAIARAAAGRLPDGFGVDVLNFQDEEGTYLPCLGSLSFTGELDDAAVTRARDRAGTPLRDAIARAGFPDLDVRLDPDRHVAFLEAHIEQGPRLEAGGLDIGVVTAIVGIRRLRIRAHGRADHAGTTPMDMRADAGMALFRLANRIADGFAAVGGAGAVWNIGSIALQPGAANVVPASAEMVVEFRDVSDATLDRLEEALRSWAADLPVPVEADVIARIRPTPMDARLGDAMEAAAHAGGATTLRMPSGAGHDAMVLARRLPSGMLFIPSIGGRSHDVVEDTAEDDIVRGCQVLADTVLRLARSAA